MMTICLSLINVVQEISDQAEEFLDVFENENNLKMIDMNSHNRTGLT